MRKIFLLSLLLCATGALAQVTTKGVAVKGVTIGAVPASVTGFIHVVQTANGGSSCSGTACATNSFTSTAGHALVAAVENAAGGAATSVTHAGGGALTQIGSTFDRGDGQTLQFFIVKNIAGSGSETVTANYPSIAFAYVYVWEVANYDLTTPVITSSTGSGTTTITTAAYTTTSARALILTASTAFNTSATYSSTDFGNFMDSTGIISGAIGGAGHRTVASIQTGTTDTFHVATSGGAPASIFSVALADSDQNALHGNYIADGDSITAGFGITTPWTDSLSLTGEWRVTNVAVSGALVEDRTAAAPTVVDPLFFSTVSKNIVSIEAGTNNCCADTAAQTYALLVTYAAGRRSAGYKVIAVTMIDRCGAPYAAFKAAYNILIRAGVGTDFDGVADIAANANLGADGACSNLTYFQADQIHPTQLSATSIIAPIEKTAIEAQ